jgi:hypothetical protein
MTEQTTETTTYDPFTDPESLVVTLRGGRVALYDDGTWIAVRDVTPELAEDIRTDLFTLSRDLPDRLATYFADQTSSS